MKEIDKPNPCGACVGVLLLGAAAAPPPVLAGTCLGRPGSGTCAVCAACWCALCALERVS